MTNLPDQNHIDEICRKLWLDREFGRAAVMIGAGFSRNAEKISPSSPSFPLWFQLENKLKERLYPNGNGNSNPLKLASEYRATFGQQALDDFLLEFVPDDHYIPGKLHKLLLNLPWADVFTTNYDTLLERTRPSIYDRKYDVVHTCEDLTRGMKPRIIKLHGSFPSYRPFIFTEEDYRTYPKQFAPFVNTVQQSMMENSFCLLGFSGEDPNFLNWLGWIRDSLGTSIPPIYLCGILNLSNTTRQIYTQRNIIPIDLAPLYPNNHELATEWFLRSLLEAKPLDLTCWPNSPSPSSLLDFPVSVGLCERKVYSKNYWQPGQSDPSFAQELTDSDIQDVLRIWKDCRIQYPGWIILPRDKRNSLWWWTKEWIEPIFKWVAQLNTEILNNQEELQEEELRKWIDILSILYELNWRLEKSLYPLFQHQEIIISKFLKKSDPFSVNFISKVRDNNYLNINNLSIDDLHEYWIDLAFAVMKEARQDLDESRFNSWKDTLNLIVNRKYVWKSRWFYEQCLWYLFKFEINKLENLLRQWNSDKNSTLWDIRRASLYIEIGDLQFSKNIFEEALNKIRDSLQKTPFDYHLLYQEALAILLLDRISKNDWSKIGGEYDSRKKYLSLHLCDPENELTKLRNLVAKLPLKNQVSRNFLHGDSSCYAINSYVSSEDFSMEEIRSAFELLLLSEDAGIPVKCGSVYDSSFTDAAKWIYLSAPRWAVSILIRLQNKDILNDWFSEVFVATLSENQVLDISLTLVKALEEDIQNLKNRKLSRSMRDRMEFFTQFLSRLCFRLNEESLERSFNAIMSTLESDDSLVTRNHINSIFRNLFPNLSEDLVCKYLPKIIKTGLSLADLDGESRRYEMSIPLSLISLSNIEKDKIQENTYWSKSIRDLLLMVEHASTEIRGEAASRLYYLYRNSLLSDLATDQYRQALWSKKCALTGLPAETNFYPSTFIDLCDTDRKGTMNLVKVYLLESEIPPIIRTIEGLNREISYTIGDESFNYMATLLNVSSQLFPNSSDTTNTIDWSSSELTWLLEKLNNYWKSNSRLILDWHSRFSSIMGKEIEVFIKEYWLPILSRSIIPNLTDISDIQRDLLDHMIEDIKSMDIPVLCIFPPMLRACPDRASETESLVKQKLNSNRSGEVKEAIHAYYYWIIQSYYGKYQPPQVNLINPIIDLVIAAKRPILAEVLSFLAILIAKNPQLFEVNQLKQILVGLQYLIQDTDLPDNFQIEEDYCRIPISDRLRYRRDSAHLACQIYYWYDEFVPDEPKPETLLKWKEICLNDVVPKVRKAWHHAI